jgi:hypothetical protein
MKRAILYISIIACLTACTSDDDTTIVPGDVKHAISFNTNDQAEQVTRADNTVGLNTLGITEIKVYGYKTLTSTAQDGTTTTTLQNVMPGYTLRYQAGTANSSTSNTKGWEYVGLTDATTGEAVKDYMNEVQEIKYWDGNCSDYRFFGVLPGNVDKLYYGDSQISSSSTLTTSGAFSMKFTGLTYMTRTPTRDANGNVITDANGNIKYRYYKKNSTAEADTVSEKDIPMYGTMWQGDPSSSNFDYTKPVTLAFSKPYALIRVVFVRPDGTSVAQLGDKTSGSATPYSAKFNPTNSSIPEDGSVDVTWSMTGTEESTTATASTPSLAKMVFDPIELTEAEKRYQAWPEYVMIPSTGTSSDNDYICSVYVIEPNKTNPDTRTAFVPKEFTHWKAGYEYTYVFKITYNNSLEFSHVVETYTKWQAGYVDTTTW